MIIFPDYVASFTSEYTYKAAFAKLLKNENEYKGKLSLVNCENGEDYYKLSFVQAKKNIKPNIEVTIKERVDGALVFSRINAKKSAKILALSIITFYVLLASFFVTLAFLSEVSYWLPLAFIPLCLISLPLIERFWAKMLCIKTYRLICNALDYKPQKVMIIKVLRKK